MPHFILECSHHVSELRPVRNTIEEILAVAEDSGLFNVQDIKIRMKFYEEYIVGSDDSDFIHVFASIMEGRTTAQKQALSKMVVQKLVALYPQVPNIAMNVWEFEKATYIKRQMLV